MVGTQLLTYLHRARLQSRRVQRVLTTDRTRRPLLQRRRYCWDAQTTHEH